ncbi:tRNA pseudouridine(38-40) synthase TruA [Thermodesulfobacteriota bacterium]
MRNIKLTIEYDGAAYHGWQVQPEAGTIQGVMEEVIGRIVKEPVCLIAAGRTDAGVHALGQVANFHTDSSIPPDALKRGLNSLLPDDIVIRASEEVPFEFNARKKARGKRYRYVILNQRDPSARHRFYSWHVREPIDVDSMRRGAGHLSGRHDFSSFRASGCGSRSPVKDLWRLDVEPATDGAFLHIVAEADGFLRYMVRNIVGTLVDVGRGRRLDRDLKEILECRNRGAAGATAPPQGLFLMEVFFGEKEIDR